MKFLKWFIYALLTIVFVGYLAVRLFVHQGEPELVQSDADQVANEMLAALNKPAWDTLKYIKWTFPRERKYVWDKTNNTAIISWGDDHEVHLRLDDVDGKVYKAGSLISGEDAESAKQTAWSNWCNDSFWLIAPYKVFDPGTTRSMAKDDDGKEGLLITYESGGVTPGDRYLWFLDENKRPTGYRMWVKIIPIGGLYSSWEDWKDFNGAKIATKHGMGAGPSIEMTDVAAGQSWSDLGYDSNPIKA